ncbi:MAG: rhodanese-like domain-containing protein [Deltaproteobacteria bacterium]|nr:rhodanese-like domain-containing protein [Deltaproteobacteria bacterium]
MRSANIGRAVIAALLVATAAGAALAMDAAELRQALEAGDRLTVIDVRPNKAFREAHIPGAINVPAPVLPRKRLPPLGRVVVCGDGLRPDVTSGAVEELNRRPGIRAEALEGGFGAWEAMGLASTRTPGTERAAIRQLAFGELRRMVEAGADVMLVDLRGGGSGVGSGWDLGEAFPGAQVSSGRPAGEPDPRTLYVLVDDGDGSADSVALRLRAAGYRRVAVLAGGAIALERQGRSSIETRTFYMKEGP